MSYYSLGANRFGPEVPFSFDEPAFSQKFGGTVTYQGGGAFSTGTHGQISMTAQLTLTYGAPKGAGYYSVFSGYQEINGEIVHIYDNLAMSAKVSSLYVEYGGLYYSNFLVPGLEGMTSGTDMTVAQVLASSPQALLDGDRPQLIAGSNLNDGPLRIGAHGGYLFAYAGNDTVVGSDARDQLYGDDYKTAAQADTNYDDLIYGMGGRDYIVGGPGSDRIDGGKDVDRAGFDGKYSEYSGENGLGWDAPFYYDNAHVIKATEGFKDVLTNIERFEFDDKKFVLTKWATSAGLDEVPRLNKQVVDGKTITLTTPSIDFMTMVLGTPSITWKNGHIAAVTAPSHRVDRLAESGVKLTPSFKVDGVKIGGISGQSAIDAAFDSLRGILNKAAKIDPLKGSEAPDLLDNLTSAGMLYPRVIKDTDILSNHTWGTAIDLKVDGILDHTADRTVHRAIAELIPLFNAAGWKAGAGFKGNAEDDMHFEMSTELLTKLLHVKVGDSGGKKYVGGNDGNVFHAKGGNDTMIGGDEDDVFRPGQGKDIMHGGKGMDFYIFDTPAAAGNADVIDDFNTGDEINLSSIYFDLGYAGQELPAYRFTAGGLASTPDHRIVYDKKNGAVFYDVDGSGAAAPVLVVTIDKDINLRAHDFFIV